MARFIDVDRSIRGLKEEAVRIKPNEVVMRYCRLVRKTTNCRCRGSEARRMDSIRATLWRGIFYIEL